MSVIAENKAGRLPPFQDKPRLRPDLFQQRFGVEPNEVTIDCLIRDVFSAMDLFSQVRRFTPPKDTDYWETYRRAYERDIWYAHRERDIWHTFPPPPRPPPALMEFMDQIKEIPPLVAVPEKSDNGQAMRYELFHGNSGLFRYRVAHIFDTISVAVGKDLKWLEPYIGYSREELLRAAKAGKFVLTPKQLAFIEKPGFRSFRSL